MKLTAIVQLDYMNQAIYKVFRMQVLTYILKYKIKSLKTFLTKLDF